MFEMRYHGVSGVMPFKLFEYITPKSPESVQEKIRHAIQAKTIFLWPRREYGEASTLIQREMVICNDGETESTFEVTWKWENETGKTQTIRLAPAAQQRITFETGMPKQAKKLIAVLKQNNQVISSDTLSIQPITVPKLKATKKLHIYKNETLGNTLSEMGISFVSDDKVPQGNDKSIWIIPEHADNRALFGKKDEIMEYLNKGGTILCLKQEQQSKWLPVNLPFWSAYQAGIHTYALNLHYS